MFWQSLELLFRPRSYGVKIAVFIAHESQLVRRQCNRFCAHTKKATDIDDHLRRGSHAVHMCHGADLGLRNGATLQVPLALMNAIAQSIETTPDKVLSRDGTALTGEVGQSLSRLLPQLSDDLMLRPSETPPPRMVRAIKLLVEDVLCEMMGKIIEEQSWRRVFPAFHRVRQAEEIMHANSDEPLSMQEIAQVLGVSLRSLQLAFAEVYGGLSPRDVLNRIRLEKARARLLAADGNAQVTTVAMDSGLFHLGRFSQAYARAFGEKPSETLLRRRVS